MFVGTTPPEVRLLLTEILKEKKPDDVYIGCSGNYTVDKLASHLGARVHSNDVSLYSKIIADIILGKETEMEVVNEQFYEIFDAWEETKYMKLVEVMYVMKLSEFAPRKNDYQKTWFQYYIEENLSFYRNTVEKFERTKSLDFQIHDFYYGDFVTHINEKKGKGVGILFPPTYKGGYEKLFKYVDSVFSYIPAEYEMFDPAAAQDTFRSFLEEDENIIYSDRDHEYLHKFLLGKVRLTGGKKDIFIYSSLSADNKYYIERQKQLKFQEYNLIPQNYSFTDQTEIRILKCRTDEVNYYKQFFMSAKVDYTTGGDFGILFFADNRLFGMASFSKMLGDGDNIFIQSDFVVPSNEKRLSKLLITLLKSEEIRDIMTETYYHYYQGLKTSVYTDKPVSMKYRGVFTLQRRDKGKLVYQAEFSGNSLKSQYTLWKKMKDKASN